MPSPDSTAEPFYSAAAGDAGELYGDTTGGAPVVVPAPDPARDARVAVRRAEDARKAGVALVDLMRQRSWMDAASYKEGWHDGYAASELHHNGPYDVTDETAVHVPHRHHVDGGACWRADCHTGASTGVRCTYCGDQPCRVEWGYR